MALLNSSYTKHFVIFTATTATFGVNNLIFNILSGSSRGGSRVTKVAVEALFCQKHLHFLIKTGDFHSKYRLFFMLIERRGNNQQ